MENILIIIILILIFVIISNKKSAGRKGGCKLKERTSSTSLNAMPECQSKRWYDNQYKLEKIRKNKP